MAATRNEYASPWRQFFPASSPGGRTSFLVLSQGNSFVQFPLPPRGTSVQGRLPQALGFPTGEPPLQVSLHGALQASIPSLEGVFIPGSLAMGLGSPATYHLRGTPLPRSPLPAYASGLYPLSALPKEPPSQDPSRDSIHYPGGTAYAWYPLPRGKPLHPGLTYGGPPSGRTSVPDKTPYRPPFPAPFGSVVCPLRGVFTPAAPLRTRRPPPSFPTQKQDFRWTPSPQAGLPPSPPPPPAALRCPLRLRRAG